MKYFVLLAVGVLAILLVSRYILRRRNEPEYYDAAELKDAVRALVKLMNQLIAADRMLADLAACDPKSLLRGFRVGWFGIDGKGRKLDFLATGKNKVTAGLRAAAQEQRDEINDQIIDIVRAMAAALDDGRAPALTVDGVGKTVDRTDAEDLPGEC